jgi:hypothetical protein
VSVALWEYDALTSYACAASFNYDPEARCEAPGESLTPAYASQLLHRRTNEDLPRLSQCREVWSRSIKALLPRASNICVSQNTCDSSSLLTPELANLTHLASLHSSLEKAPSRARTYLCSVAPSKCTVSGVTASSICTESGPACRTYSRGESSQYCVPRA